MEAEEENVQSKSNDKPQQDKSHSQEQTENVSVQEQSKEVVSQESQDHHSEEEPEPPITRQKIDLRDKLREKSNNPRECYVGNGQGMEDDDGEEAKERRNRFQSERTVAPKMNHDIPDSLENVVTAEQHRPHYRSRDRGDRDRSEKGDRERSDRGDRGDRNERGDRGDRGDRSDRGDRRNIRGRSGGRYDSHQSGR